MTSPWARLSMTERRPKRGSARSLGGWFMQSASAASASKTTEQAGSMISSRKTIWTGKRASGHSNSTGMRDMPAIGT